MPAFVRPSQNSFTSGEVSPRLHSRSDFENYYSAVETLENFIILPQGGAQRRVGTRFVAEVKDSTKFTRLFSFQFNDEQAYVVEAGVGYFRFYKNQGRLVVADTDAAITNGTFTTDLTGWTERNDGTGDVAQASGVARFTANGAGNEARLNQQVTIGAGFQAALHVLKFKVAAGTIRLRIGTSAGGEQIKAATSYSKGFHTVSFTPNASPFIEFEHNGTGDVDLDDVVLLDNQPIELTTPYSEVSLPELQFDQSADVMWIVHRSFKPRKLQRFGDSDWSIIDYTPTADPFTSATNFPRAVAFWKSRLWFGGTDTDPEKIWGTQVDDFENLDLGTGLDDEAITRQVAGGKVNVIQWLLGGNERLFIGTFGSEMILKGGADKTVTPKNVNIDSGTEKGSALVQPIRIDNVPAFVQRSHRKLRLVAFDLDSDAFKSPNLMILAEHLTDSFAIVELAYREDPDSILWALRADGILLGLTYLAEHKVLGWHRHITENISYESMAVIPDPDLGRDQTWVVATRVVNGSTKQYVEFFADDDSGFYGGTFLDSHLIGDFTGNPQVAVGGLDHLEGETVHILGDGAVYAPKVVTGGQVALDPAAELIEVGLPYTSKLVSLRPESDGRISGSTVGRATTKVRVLDTITIKINGYEVPERAADDLMDKPPPATSGDLEVPQLGWGPDEGKVTIEQSLPIPTTILSIRGNLSVGDE